MTLGDLVFIPSFLFVLIWCVRIAVAAARRRWPQMRRSARTLAWFGAVYAVTLIAVSVALPRGIHAPGDRHCFDDWCMAAVSASLGEGAETGCRASPGTRIWIAVGEVSSVAKRVRQRELGAWLELEDRAGRRYLPCGGPLSRGGEPARALADELGPDESFRVALPFSLPQAAEPAGLVLRHGAFPGVVIIGDDQSFLHTPALLRLTVNQRR